MGSPTFPVLSNDYGIRPAGPPDECFYCGRKVGRAHSDECVVIVRDVTYGVYVGDVRRGDERRIGSFVIAEPAHWDEGQCEFMRNDGTWCVDNVRDSGRYEGEELPTPTENGCLCDLIHMAVEKMGDEVRRGSDGRDDATRGKEGA